MLVFSRILTWEKLTEKDMPTVRSAACILPERTICRFSTEALERFFAISSEREENQSFVSNDLKRSKTEGFRNSSKSSEMRVIKEASGEPAAGYI